MSSTLSAPTFEFPSAAAPDIIRSDQKDTYYTTLLHTKLSSLLRTLYGARLLHTHAAELTLFTQTLYLSLTTLRNTRTLGEEYCDILHTPSTLTSRAGYILTTTLLPYLLPKLRSRLKRRCGTESEKAKALWKWVETVPQTVLTAHLAWFYFVGGYYTIAKRVWGLKYVFTRKLGKGEERVGYEVLGVLLMVQLAVQGWGVLKEQPEGEEVDGGVEKVERVEVDLGVEGRCGFLKGEMARKCTLCLEEMKEPTATPCGHVFCWGCVSEWCKTKPECPLCRQGASCQQLLPLRG